MLVHNPTAGRFTVAFARYDESAVGLLTHREQLEYATLTPDSRRRDWLAGRQAAKQVVARMFAGLHPHDVELRSHAAAQCTAHPEPGTQNPAPGLPVSISHCDGIAIAAASDLAVRVGVDIERVDAVSPRHARYFISPRERGAAELIGPAVVWALKESAWKALALDHTVPFSDLELCVARDGHLRGVHYAGAWLPAHARIWTRAPDMVATVVCITQHVQ